MTQTTSARLTGLSPRDMAFIVFQVFVGYGLSDPPMFHPNGLIQCFGIACAAYMGMVISLVFRNREQGFTGVDRKVILYGFLPILFFTVWLTSHIWRWKYGQLLG